MKTSTVRKSDYAYTGVNPLVSRQAMQFFQSNEQFVSVRDVPLIKVDAAQGVLSFVDQDLLNTDDVRERSNEAEAEKGVLGFRTVNYTTDARSLEFDINALNDARITREAGGNLSTTVPRALALKANIHTEGRFSALWASGSWYRTVTGNAADSGTVGTTTMNRVFWSTAANDPIAAIRAEVDVFLLRTGLLPTNLRLGRNLFTSIASHPLVRAQVSLMVAGASAVAGMTMIATAAQLSQLVGMKVSVSSGIKNTGKQQGTASNSFIIASKDALMTYDTPGAFNAVSSGDGSPPIVDLGAPTGFARVAYTGVTPEGMAVRSFPRPEIGAGGSMAYVLDIYNGFVIVDNKFGTYFSAISQ